MRAGPRGKEGAAGARSPGGQPRTQRTGATWTWTEAGEVSEQDITCLGRYQNNHGCHQMARNTAAIIIFFLLNYIYA